MKKLLSALFEAQKEIKPALKSTDNPFFKSKYADLNEVHHAVKASLEKNGLLVSQITELGEGNMPILITRLFHVESGESIESKYPVVYSKPDPQGIGSGLTYARRYQLATICGVVTEDDDGEKAMDRTTETKSKTYIEKKVNPLPVPFPADKGQVILKGTYYPEKPKKQTDPEKQAYIDKLTSAKDLIELQSLIAEVKAEWNTEQFKAYVKTLEHKLRAGFEEEMKEIFTAEEVKPETVQKKGVKK